MALKFKKKYVMLMATAAMIAAPMSYVYAASTTIDATAVFRAAITLTPVADMDFADIDYTGAPAGGDTATLNTDGTIAYAGNFTGAGTGTAGVVEITTGTDGLPVDVSCDATATLTDGAGASIGLSSIGIVQSANTGATIGTACAGVGVTSLSFNLDLVTDDQLVLGGVLDGATAAAFVGGTYSTALALGDDVEVQVVYQ